MTFVTVRLPVARRNWPRSVMALCLSVGACSNPAPAPVAEAPVGGTLLRGAGSTFSAPLFAKWTMAYHQSHPSTQVTYDSVGSAEGVRRFIGEGVVDIERIDFGASDSAMSDAELARTAGDTLMVPVTGACVVLAYHVPGVPGDLKLSRKAYLGIFHGDVNTWDDPLIQAANPSVTLPDLAIGRAVRQDGSGTTFAFANHLAAISDSWRQEFTPATLIAWPGQALRGRGNEGVAGLVKNFDGFIGYVGYEFAQKLNLDVATLENRAGKFVRPTEQSCGAGLATADVPDNLRAFVPDPAGADSYPIVTFSWALLREKTGDPRTLTALHDFIEWCLQDGQRYASQLGYVPLPAAVAARALNAVKAEATASAQTR